MGNAILVESEVARSFIIAPQLPFPRNTGSVTTILEKIGECHLIQRQGSKVDVVAKSILACHDLHAGGRAKRRRVAVLETNPIFCQAVQIRRLVSCTPVAPQALDSHIIRHYEDDVRLLGTTLPMQAKTGEY